MSGQLMLSARGVRMEYWNEATRERLVALDDLDLDVVEGEFVSIVGPSGCGKSTLLKIVNGLLDATRGEIRLRVAAHGRQEAMVFQDSSLFPWYKVIDNVAFGLICAGVPRREALSRARPLIELVGLAGFEGYYPHQLSGGMQQRANLARALAVDPNLLLMDEPFAALDAQTRELMQAELLRIWNEARKTVLFVTHQIGEAVFLADRVVVMGARPGRIVADIRIELPRPRAIGVKRTPPFTAYEEQIWALIVPQLQAASDPLGGGA